MKTFNVQSLAALAMLLAFACTAYAVDGVVLINQSAALAGNVTPGDAPGFPITISLSGSYRLSGNLTVSDPNTDAIQITADDVTIDLNGFSIIGPIVCKVQTGPPPVTCSPAGSGTGILTGNSNITVLNGKIRGMGTGLNLAGDAGRVEKVHALSNGGVGIVADSASVISSSANRNGGTGIQAAVAIGNTANDNGNHGIFVLQAAIDNVALGNGGNGINAAPSLILGNTVKFSGGQGIFASCPSNIVSNMAERNTGGDIFTGGSGCTRSNNNPVP